MLPGLLGCRSRSAFWPSAARANAFALFSLRPFFRGLLGGRFLWRLGFAFPARPGLDLADAGQHQFFQYGLVQGLQPRQQHGPGFVVVGDVEKPGLRFQHHIAHLDGADA